MDVFVAIPTTNDGFIPFSRWRPFVDDDDENWLFCNIYIKEENLKTMDVFILTIDSVCLNEMESRAYQVTFLHLASACQNAVKELNSVTTQTNSSVAQNNDKQRHTNRPSIFFGKINFQEKTLGHKLANLLLLLKHTKKYI